LLLRQPSSSSSFGRRQGYHDSPSEAPARHNRKREGSLTSLPWQSNLPY
jgi:hypothetical protein